MKKFKSQSVTYLTVFTEKLYSILPVCDQKSNDTLLSSGFYSFKSEMTGIKLEKRESVSKNYPNETKQEGRRSTKNATASPSRPHNLYTGFTSS